MALLNYLQGLGENHDRRKAGKGEAVIPSVIPAWTWSPANEEAKYFQNLIAGGDLANIIGQIAYDSAAGVWRCFRPISRPIGFSPDMNTARKMVESHKE